VLQLFRAPQPIESAQLAHHRLDSRLASFDETPFQAPAVVRRIEVRGSISLNLIRREL
jgi:hypothetical protein